jgi:H+/gluconate symporter-like permease
VLPATVVNTIVMIVLYPIVQSIFRRAKLAVQQ